MMKRFLLAALVALISTGALAQQLDSGTVMGNSRATAGPPRQETPGAILDRAFSAVNGTVLCRSAGAWNDCTTPVLGIPGTSTGTLGFAGATSGTVTVTPQATAGTTTITWPNTSGTVPTTATAPIVLNATTGNLTCPTCFLTSGGQAVTRTDDTNVTMTLGGSAATGAVNAFSMTMGWTGQLSAARGGTGVNNTATSGRYLKGNGTGFATSTGDASGTGSCGGATFVKSLNSDAAPTCDTPAGGGTVTSVVGNGVTITTTGTVPPPFGLVNHSLAVSAAGSALTIALKDNAGSDPSAASPVNGYFRDVTTATGSWTQLTVTGALSLTVSSGSTLGVTSSTAFRLWVVLFNDGGTARLGVINCASSANSIIYPLVQGQVASSTAEGGAGAADSAGVIYTGTAVASKAYLIVGYVEWSSSGLTAGTWTTTNLLYTQSYGFGIRLPGEVIQSVPGVATSRGTESTSTSYTATGVTLSGSITPTSAANPIRVSVSGTLCANCTATTGNNVISVRTIRGGSAVQVGNNIQSSGITSAAVIVGATMGPALDFPNTTSAQAYTPQVKTSNAATGVTFPYGDTADGNAVGYILMEEVQR